MNSCRGNVLFLILIAVALFAALSYAVTSSSRSGGSSDVSKEKARLIVSQIEQYSAALSSSIMRMTLTGGMTLEQVDFSCVGFEYTDAVACSAASPNWQMFGAAQLKYQMFYLHGGGVAPVTPKNLGIPRTNFSGWEDGFPSWVDGATQIHGVGSTNTSNASGVDLSVRFYDIPKSVCTLFNEKAGISGIPSVAIGWPDVMDSRRGYGDFYRTNEIGDASNGPQFYGKFSGCMEDSVYPGHYALYSVIKAR